MTLEERIEELKVQEARTQMQLDEIRYVKQGYENTLKAQKEESEKQEKEDQNT
jgi:hypothetical protein